MINKNFAELDAQATTTLYSDVNGVPSISIGVQQDKTSRIRVSKPGIDVTTANDSQLVFNSAQNSLKIVLSGTTSLAVPDPFPNNGLLTATIPHGLSITPSFLAFVSIPAGSGVYGAGALTSVPAFTAGSGSMTTYVQGSTDSTNLYLKIINTFGAGLSSAPFGMTWTFRYYILQETAN